MANLKDIGDSPLIVAKYLEFIKIDFENAFDANNVIIKTFFS